jgi:hypothetical protein
VSVRPPLSHKAALTFLVVSNRNVITLEQLTLEHPDVGSVLTFLQFLVVAIYGIPKHITYTYSHLGNSQWRVPVPRLKPRKIHIASYAAQVFLFYAISLLNNAAFAYHIPMAVHIIFRSGGLVVSMILGWTLAGKQCVHVPHHRMTRGISLSQVQHHTDVFRPARHRWSDHYHTLRS